MPDVILRHRDGRTARVRFDHSPTTKDIEDAESAVFGARPVAVAQSPIPTPMPQAAPGTTAKAARKPATAAPAPFANPFLERSRQAQELDRQERAKAIPETARRFMADAPRLTAPAKAGENPLVSRAPVKRRLAETAKVEKERNELARLEQEAARLQESFRATSATGYQDEGLQEQRGLGQRLATDVSAMPMIRERTDPQQIADATFGKVFLSALTAATGERFDKASIEGVGRTVRMFVNDPTTWVDPRISDADRVVNLALSFPMIGALGKAGSAVRAKAIQLLAKGKGADALKLLDLRPESFLRAAEETAAQAPNEMPGVRFRQKVAPKPETPIPAPVRPAESPVPVRGASDTPAVSESPVSAPIEPIRAETGPTAESFRRALADAGVPDDRADALLDYWNVFAKTRMRAGVVRSEEEFWEKFGPQVVAQSEKNLKLPDGALAQRANAYPGSEVPTRLVGQTPLVSSEEAMVSNLTGIGRDPVYEGKMLNAMRNASPRLRSAASLGEVVDLLTENLIHLYDNSSKYVKQYGKLWYDGGHRLSATWADRYGKTKEQTAAILAVFSPQTDWFMNVSRAERTMDVLAKHGDSKWTSEMTNAVAGMSTDVQTLYAKAGDTLTRTRLADLSSKDKALWIRAFDQAHNPRSYRSVIPDGRFGGTVKTAKGEDARMAWASFDQIRKAVDIWEDGTLANISSRLGNEHKVRNFYNNLVSPGSARGHYTSDTHNAAAALLDPVSGASRSVSDMLGGGPSSNRLGMSGTYPVYHHAGIRAAEAIGGGVLPREVQSITWETVRSLFSGKSPALQADIKSIWNQFAEGKISRADAWDRILERSGGIGDPNWVSDLRSASEGGSSYLPEGLHPASGDGGGARGSLGGGGGGANPGAASGLVVRGNPQSVLLAQLEKSGAIKGFAEPERRVIGLILEKADASTLIHESAHIWRRALSESESAVIEKWAGVVDGKWTIEAEEKFARAVERYARDGVAPNKALEGSFAKFKAWLGNVYKRIRGSEIDVPISKEVRETFDDMFGARIEGGKKFQAEAKPPVASAKPKPVKPPVAATVEPKPAPEPVASAKNRITNEERAAIGLDELPEPERKAWETTWENARAKYSPDEARRIASEAKDGGRMISDEESAVLTIRKEELKAALKGAKDSAEAAKIVSEFDDTALALKRGGTENARALAFRRAEEATGDLDLLTLREKYIAAADRPLTKAETAEAADLAARFEALTKELDAANAKLAIRETEGFVQAEAKKSGPRTRTKDRVERIRQDRGAALERIANQAAESMKKASTAGANPIGVPVEFLAKIAPDLIQVAKLYVEEGVVRGADLVARLVDDLKARGVDVSDDEVRGVLAGAYKAPREEAEKVLTDWQRVKGEVVEEFRAQRAKNLAEERQAAQELREATRQKRTADAAEAKAKLQEARAKEKERQAAQKAADRDLAEREKEWRSGQREKVREGRRDYQDWWKNSVGGQKAKLLNDLDRLQGRLVDLDAGKLPPKRTAENVPPELEDLWYRREALRVEADKKAAALRIQARNAGKGDLESASDVLWDVAGIPRSLKATGDLSAPFNQGAFAMISNPRQWLTAWSPTLKVMREKGFESFVGEVRADAFYDRARAAGLELSALDVHPGEEMFVSKILERTPVVGSVVKFSEREYAAYLTKLRLEMFKEMVGSAQKTGASLSKEALQDAAGYVNAVTGRGMSDAAKSAGQLKLARVFFAPRYWSSLWETASLRPLRVAVNNAGKSGDWRVAKQIGKRYAQAYATATGVVAAAGPVLAAMGWNLELDPRSSDFGRAVRKAKGGETHTVDVLPPQMRQLYTVAGQLLGGKKNSKTGKVEDGFYARGQVYASLLEGKVAPTPKTAMMVKDKEAFGKSYDPATAEGWKNIGISLTAPISLEQTKELWESKDLSTSEKLFFGFLLGPLGRAPNVRPPKKK